MHTLHDSLPESKVIIVTKMKCQYLSEYAGIEHSAKKKKIFDLVASDFFHLVIEFFGEKYLNIKNP